VETDRGGFVLDNMVGHITTARESQYEFIVAESVNQPGAWVRIFR
jgi:predicted transglutaminase-like cysteine proteinase